ncbi:MULTISPECIES: SDR family NAD(P)-dependent oxidoreductase [Paraburkholderia]|uniref:SDR family NAD(P)-dependent oxidoreductase n=1 Tax=Paraburkholderia metrosideri TaxID=580937 RepID=A0ABW9E1L2_9BURK
MSKRNVIVTGAAGGIGLSCAKTLLREGHKLAVMDISADRMDQQFGDEPNAIQIHLDAGSTESCRAAIDEAYDRLGSIDALVHFAAVWSGTAWDRSCADEWHRVLTVNLTGSFLLAQAAAEKMLQDGGSIVLTASDSARVGGVAGGPAYASSKGGVIALTRSLARALGPKGIRVNAINPGVVESPMTENWPRALMEQTVARTPLGRIARPADIADVACFLASDAARFITGEIIEVNGGFYFD